MKKIFVLALAACFTAASVNAQSTVDSIAAKYKLQPMPDSLTMESTFPVIGTYQLNNTAGMSASSTSTTSTDTAMRGSSASAGNVSITLDPVNKGVVWITGLPEGKIKAYLKKSPSTYRILSQKTDMGKQIPEGTLSYDPTGNMLNIAIGAPYNETDPTAIFSMNANAGATAGTSATGTGTMDNTTMANGSTNGMTGGSKTVKIKTKKPGAKTKQKIMFYTGTKQQTTNTATSTNTGTSTNTNTSTGTGTTTSQPHQ